MALGREDFDIRLSAHDASAAAFAAFKRNIVGTQAQINLLRGALLGLGVGSALGIAQFARHAVKSLAAIGEEAERVGTSTDTLQALQFALKRSGGDARLAADGLEFFSQQTVKAANGAGPLARFVKDNNVALRDQAGNLRGTDDLLAEFARLTTNARTAQERLTIAAALFGDEAGPKMVASLDKIAREGLPAFTQAAKDANAVADKESIETARRYELAWTDAIDAVTLKLKQWTVDAVGAFVRVAQESEFTAQSVRAGFALMQQGNVAEGMLGALMGFGGLGRFGANPEALLRAGFGRAGDFSGFGPLDALIGGPAAPAGPPTITSGLGKRGGGREDKNRSAEVLALLRLEGEQLTLNVAARREAERLEQEILMIRRAGEGASRAEQEQIRGAVAALYEKKAAFEELKRQQQQLNELAQFGGDLFLDALDAAILRGEKLDDVFKNVVLTLAKAALQATFLGQGPLAGLFGTAPAVGAANTVGGIFGAMFGGGRAAGGPIDAGKMYKVHKDEWIVPGRDGTVIPARGGAGGAQPMSGRVAIDISLSVDEGGNIVPLVRQVAGEEAEIRISRNNRFKLPRVIQDQKGRSIVESGRG